MLKNNDEDFVATKAEKTFDDDGNTVVAELPKANKTSLNVIRQIGHKAKDKFSVNNLLDPKQKPAKVIQLRPKE